MATDTSLRDALRAATIGSKKEFKRTQVEHKGNTFEFVQPALRERKDLIKKVTDADGNIDSVALMVEAVIALTVVPDTEVRVYEAADRESMMGFPSGSFVDEFAGKALAILNGTSEEDAGAEDAKKD